MPPSWAQPGLAEDGAREAGARQTPMAGAAHVLRVRMHASGGGFRPQVDGPKRKGGTHGLHFFIGSRGGEMEPRRPFVCCRPRRWRETKGGSAESSSKGPRCRITLERPCSAPRHIHPHTRAYSPTCQRAAQVGQASQGQGRGEWCRALHRCSLSQKGLRVGAKSSRSSKNAYLV